MPTAPAILGAIRHATGVRVHQRAGDAAPRCAQAMRRARSAGHERRAERSTRASEREGDGIVRCDACPVLCRIRPGRAGACDRYANEDGKLVRIDPLVLLARRRPAALVAFVEGSETGTGELGPARRRFVTGIGAGTTYPDYKPAPFIVSSKHRRRRHGHRRDRGHLQLLRRQGEDRHRPLSRPRAGGGARARASRSATSPRPNTARRCCRSAACIT